MQESRIPTKPSDADTRYTFTQLFTKYGKVTKYDFPFHKAGPNKGKPRGFAFVEYKEREVRTVAVAHFY